MTKEFGRAGEGKRRRVEKPKPPPVDIKKNQLLWVKAPPYYEKEYLYEVTGAGDKSVRASLYHSPRVRKSWTAEEFALLIEMGIVRMAKDDERGNHLQSPHAGTHED
jgi:hypothetical protein